MMRKTHSFFLTSILLLFVVFLFVQNTEKTPSESFLSRESLDTLREAQNLLDDHLSSPQDQQLSDELIHAFVDSYGDQFTEYFSPEESVSFQTMIDGDFEGIGAYVEDSPGGVYVSGVLPGSPAQK